MLFVLKGKGEELKDSLSRSSASFKFLDLYGKRVLIGWPDSEMEKLDSPSIEFRVKTKKPYVLSSAEWKKERTVVDVSGVQIGGEEVVVAAGPCAIEDEEQLRTVAKSVKASGAKILRGGSFKPRTSPYSFQGLGEQGVRLLVRTGQEVGMPVVSEILDARHIQLYKEVDMLQLGTRNAQNFTLLRELGKFGKPVLLKRGMGNTVDEWLSAADYVIYEGNGSVVLCERGIRTFETSTRFTLDVGGMIVAKLSSHLPVCADPSHPAGRRELVHSLALASVAAGADMLLVEVHPRPEKALSDPEQQLTPDSFSLLMERIKALAGALGRKA